MTSALLKRVALNVASLVVAALALPGCAMLAGMPRQVKIFWTSAAVVLIAAAIVGAITRVVMAKRARRRYQQAVLQVESGRAAEALPVIRQGKKWELNPSARERWDALEMSACVQLNDLAGLMDLFDASPNPFTTDEEAALLAGRAQLETGRLDAFAELRRRWLAREGKVDQWLGQEADLLVSREQPEDAIALLRRFKFEGPADGRRLARLAYLLADQEPLHAQRAMDLAAQLGPKIADVWLFTGRFHERAGRHQAAYAAYGRAFECEPKDPFVRNHLAEFLVRQGAYTQALQVWAEAVLPPSLDLLWLKFLFWQRVANGGVGGELRGPTPKGPLTRLVDGLRKLSDEDFWDEEKLGAHIHEGRDLPEVAWLRTLEALRRGQNDEALSMLNLGLRSAHPVLENALKQVLTYHRTGFFEPGVLCLDANTPAAFRNPLYVQLDQWISGALADDPENLVDMIASGAIFPAVLRASGWNAAADRIEAAVLS